MDMKKFRKFLDTYGADFSRWDGASEGEAQSFLKSSEDAQVLYTQAKKLDDALDKLKVKAPAHAIMGNVKSRITGDNVMPFPLQIETPPWKVVIGMGLAAAAVIILVVAVTIDDSSGISIPSKKSPAVIASAAQNQVDAFLSEMASMMDEDMQADEIIAMLEETKDAPEDDIDSFLNDLFLQQEADMIEDAAAEAPLSPDQARDNADVLDILLLQEDSAQ